MKTIWIGLVLLVGGCAELSSPDPASPHVYSSGWTLRLDRSLTIEPGAATVRLQYGRIVPRNSVQEHDPFCVVELNTVGTGPQTVKPDSIEVRRVRRSVSHIAAAPSAFGGTAFAWDDGSPTFLYYITEFQLHSAAQPDLRTMTCAWNQMAPGNTGLMRHLTLDEIRSALGDWMQLLPPKRRL